MCSNRPSDRRRDRGQDQGDRQARGGTMDRRCGPLPGATRRLSLGSRANGRSKLAVVDGRPRRMHASCTSVGRSVGRSVGPSANKGKDRRPGLSRCCSTAAAAAAAAGSVWGLFVLTKEAKKGARRVQGQHAKGGREPAAGQASLAFRLPTWRRVLFDWGRAGLQHLYFLLDTQKG
jgi:hypothetical protein